jgi:GNAT superfamily N-acetyltransferase
VTAHPPVEAVRVPPEAILTMRDEYRREMACQIVHDAWHARGFVASYLLRAHGQVVGYGLVGGAPRDEKDIVKEFFVLPPFRGAALPLFRQLVAVSGARRIEAQTNDGLLLLMLYDCAADVAPDRGRSRSRLLAHARAGRRVGAGVPPGARGHRRALLPLQPALR